MNVGDPVPGLYRARRGAGYPWRPVLIFYSCPMDPHTGEPMHRSRILSALIGGKPVDPWRIWTYAAGKLIDRGEYDYLMALSQMPGQPEATPEQRIDLNQLPPVYTRRTPR